MLGKRREYIVPKNKGILVGVLCVGVVSGCGTKASEVALVSGFGGTVCRGKGGGYRSISLVDGGVTGKEVKKIDLASLGYFEDEENI